MRIQTIITQNSKNQRITLWNDKNGVIKYIINGGEVKTLEEFMIRESIHNYYVSPVEDRLIKKFQGTKTDCLHWLEKYISEKLINK